MPAAYDYYDYPSYWEGREYEHESEVIAIKAMLSKVKKIRSVVDIGAGYARLADLYKFRAKKIVLTDPSAKLLKLARKRLKNDSNIVFVQAKLETLPKKLRAGSFDLAIVVRVSHHMKDLEDSIKIIKKLIKKNGYLIFEFPNKRHFKAVIRQIAKGNFTFPIEIFPKNLSKKEKHIPFKNYHPDVVRRLLKKYGFEIIETRSVSNLRIKYLKILLPTSLLLSIETKMQTLLATICFGPSIFILAKKK